MNEPMKVFLHGNLKEDRREAATFEDAVIIEKLEKALADALDEIDSLNKRLLEAGQQLPQRRWG